ncbi:uncharacterized protein [Hetaerina americana]|uniref:uncharacterized protein n=1 Tax=Hetaerina americana TaxID=62018 RepID=UPI003A7F3BE3
MGASLCFWWVRLALNAVPDFEIVLGPGAPPLAAVPSSAPGRRKWAKPPSAAGERVTKASSPTAAYVIDYELVPKEDKRGSLAVLSRENGVYEEGFTMHRCFKFYEKCEKDECYLEYRRCHTPRPMAVTPLLSVNPSDPKT